MLLTAESFPVLWLIIAHIIYWLILGLTLIHAPWRRLNNEISHVFLGTCVIVLVLWQIKADFPQDVSVHLLGATVLTLMFGVPLALIAMTAVLFGTLLNTGAHWTAFGLNALIGGVLPVLISFGVAELVSRWLPAHVFVYIFCTAFLGAIAAVAAVGLASTVLLIAVGVYGLREAFWQYGSAHLLLMFPEGFINGGTISVLIMERSGWVVSYDEDRYLRK